MATTIWALRRSEATNGRVGFVTIHDDELAGQLLKKGDAQALRGGRLQRVDPAWPDGLQDKLASGDGKAKRRGRPPKDAAKDAPKDKADAKTDAPKLDLKIQETPPKDEQAPPAEGKGGKAK